nr:hypothetical protein [Tanacetum cinerariifolium]
KTPLYVVWNMIMVRAEDAAIKRITGLMRFTPLQISKRIMGLMRFAPLQNKDILRYLRFLWKHNLSFLWRRSHWSSVLINGVKYKGTDPTCRNTNIVVDAILETPTNSEGASISKEDTP